MNKESKKCVNGNCSIRKSCALHHQAKNIFEARGANGLYVRHSCRKGKCDHLEPKETGLVCPVDEQKCDLCFLVRNKPCSDCTPEVSHA